MQRRITGDGCQLRSSKSDTVLDEPHPRHAAVFPRKGGAFDAAQRWAVKAPRLSWSPAGVVGG